MRTGRVALTRHHLVPRTLHKRVRTRRNFTRAERHAVILLCCPCHKQIHVVFTESELARDYASIEAIAAHPEIARFVRWVVRQPSTADILVRCCGLKRDERHDSLSKGQCPSSAFIGPRRTDTPVTQPRWPRFAPAGNAAIGFGISFPNSPDSAAREPRSSTLSKTSMKPANTSVIRALRARYEEITAAILEKLGAGVPLERLMGGSTDAFKLVSSLTLFRTAASQLADEASATLARRCDDILRITALEGYPTCSFTAERLKTEDE